MALNEKQDKILSIDVTDTSYLTSSTLSLPVNWSNVADDIEYNNAVVLATAMARGIDQSRIVKDPEKEKEELPPPPTFDKNNSAPDMKKIMIDETIEIEKSTNQQEQERSLLVEQNKKLINNIKFNKYIWYTNRWIWGTTVIRTIEESADLSYPHIYDVAGQSGKQDNQMSRVYIMAHYRNKVGLFQVDRPVSAKGEILDFDNVNFQDFIQVGDFRKKFSSLAIVFDGDFISVVKGYNDPEQMTVDNYTGFKFQAEDVIWILFVWQNGLYAQKGLQGSAIKIADDAVEIVAERGYKPEDYNDKSVDQGIIAAYLSTSGIIKTLVQVRIADDRRSSWLKDIEIKGALRPGMSAEDPNVEDKDKYQFLYTNIKPQHIQIHRLNDYRVGIMASFNKKFTVLEDGSLKWEDKRSSVWHITRRFYSFMSMPPEKFKVPMIYYKFMYIGLKYKNEPRVELQPKLEWSYDYNKTITIKSDCDLRCLDGYNVANSFSVTYGVIKIESVKILEDNKTIKIKLKERAEGDFRVQLTRNIKFIAWLNAGDNRMGQVAIKTQDFFVHIAEEYESPEETFKVPMIYYKDLKINIKQKGIEEYESPSETFKMPMIYYKDLKIKIKQKGVEQQESPTETFKVPMIYYKDLKISISQIDVDPT